MLSAQAIHTAITAPNTTSRSNAIQTAGVKRYVVENGAGNAWEITPTIGVKVRSVVFDKIKAGTCVDGLIHTAEGQVFQVVRAPVLGIGDCAEFAAPDSAAPEAGDA
jgi:hypothetical protein